MQNPHASCSKVLNNICSSGLTYKLNKTPFSVYITNRKKFTKDHTPTHTNPETIVRNLQNEVDNLKADLDYKSKMDGAEKESLKEKLKDADLEIKNAKELLRLLRRALDQIASPLRLPQGAKLFCRVHPCMERSFRKGSKKIGLRKLG